MNYQKKFTALDLGKKYLERQAYLYRKGRQQEKKGKNREETAYAYCTAPA